LDRDAAGILAERVATRQDAFEPAEEIANSQGGTPTGLTSPNRHFRLTAVSFGGPAGVDRELSGRRCRV